MEIDLEWDHFSFPRLLGASAVGYAIENLFAYPLFIIKTREQISTSERTRNFGAGRAIFQQIIRENGFKGFYKGYFTAVGAGMPSVQAYLLTYHYAKHQLSSNEGFSSQLVAPMLAGIAAEGTSLGLYIPVDLVCQRLQMRENKNKTGRQLFGDILRKEGIKGLYKGFGVTVLTLGLSSGTWWLFYEQFKVIFSNLSISSTFSVSNKVDAFADSALIDRSKDVGQGPKIGSILAGIVGGSAATIVSQPFDVVKTRIQTFNAAASVNLDGKAKPVQYSGLVQGFRTIYVTEGFKGFLRGLPSKLFGRVPIHAFLTFSYELMLYIST